MQNNPNDNLHGWLFTYNQYDKLWYACERQHYFDLFNERRSAGLLRNEDFEALKANIILIMEQR